MAFTDTQVEALRAPLNRSHVKQRSQAGRSLSYIEGWHAIAEANRIFGFDGWHRETVELRQLGELRTVPDKYGKEQFRVGYMARVRITVLTGSGAIVRDGCGFGSGIDKDPDQAHESALKEAETDAMKRALMTFGNPFGLALYDKEQREVVADEPPRKAADEPTVTRPAKSPGIVAETLVRALGMAETVDELRTWAAENKPVIESLPEGYANDVRKAYQSHMRRLTPREAAE